MESIRWLPDVTFVVEGADVAGDECASPKSGQGCTTIAAVLAVLAEQSNQPTLLLDTRGDAAPILGVSDPAPASTFADAVEPCDRLRVASVAGDGIVIRDIHVRLIRLDNQALLSIALVRG